MQGEVFSLPTCILGKIQKGVMKRLLSIVLIILLIFGAGAGIEIPGIIKKKQWRELGIFIVFFTLAFVIITLHFVFEFDFSVITAWLIKVFSVWT
jgi:hypothetical protein